MRPSATTSVLATSGPGPSPERSASREAEGNGRQAVDGPGDVTRSEGVVWGRLRTPVEAGAQLGAPFAPIAEVDQAQTARPASFTRWLRAVAR